MASEKANKREKREGTEPSNRPAGPANQPLASLYPFLDLSHFYSHPLDSSDRLYAISSQFTPVSSSIVPRPSYHLQLPAETFDGTGTNRMYPIQYHLHADNQIMPANCLRSMRCSGSDILPLLFARPFTRSIFQRDRTVDFKVLGYRALFSFLLEI